MRATTVQTEKYPDSQMCRTDYFVEKDGMHTRDCLHVSGKQAGVFADGLKQTLAANGLDTAQYRK